MRLLVIIGALFLVSAVAQIQDFSVTTIFDTYLDELVNHQANSTTTVASLITNPARAFGGRRNVTAQITSGIGVLDTNSVTCTALPDGRFSMSTGSVGVLGSCTLDYASVLNGDVTPPVSFTGVPIGASCWVVQPGVITGDSSLTLTAQTMSGLVSTVTLPIARTNPVNSLYCVRFPGSDLNALTAVTRVTHRVETVSINADLVINFICLAPEVVCTHTFSSGGVPVTPAGVAMGAQVDVVLSCENFPSLPATAVTVEVDFLIPPTVGTVIPASRICNGGFVGVGNANGISTVGINLPDSQSLNCAFSFVAGSSGTFSLAATVRESFTGLISRSGPPRTICDVPQFTNNFVIQAAPTAPPTNAPTAPPTNPPTNMPVGSPTNAPFPPPTVPPTNAPFGTIVPTNAPFPPPTVPPTNAPFGTIVPTNAPFPPPTVPPTNAPFGTVAPTNAPFPPPTVPPTNAPVPTIVPTNAPFPPPTVPPTNAPVPTIVPTNAPFPPPTAPPTNAPFPPPTNPPTNAPFAPPTNSPTNAPTNAPFPPPTNPPTNAPFAPPTNSPTNAPTNSPTLPPTNAPTNAPFAPPTNSPTNAPVGCNPFTLAGGVFPTGNFLLADGANVEAPPPYCVRFDGFTLNDPNDIITFTCAGDAMRIVFDAATRTITVVGIVVGGDDVGLVRQNESLGSAQITFTDVTVEGTAPNFYLVSRNIVDGTFFFRNQNYVIRSFGSETARVSPTGVAGQFNFLSWFLRPEGANRYNDDFSGLIGECIPGPTATEVVRGRTCRPQSCRKCRCEQCACARREPQIRERCNFDSASCTVVDSNQGAVSGSCVVVTATGVAASITGTSGSDCILLEAGAVVNGPISTGDGNDYVRLETGSFEQTVSTGDGNDFISISGKSNAGVDAGDGDDCVVVTGGDGGDVDAGNGNDCVSVNGGMLGAVSGGYGDDCVAARDGSFVDSIGRGDREELGDDCVIVDSSTVHNGIKTGAGADTTDIYKSQVASNIVGGPGPNCVLVDLSSVGDITTNADEDRVSVMHSTTGRISLNAGDDSFRGLQATVSNYVSGGPGDDQMVIQGVKTRFLLGFDGDDCLESSMSEVFVRGGDGTDTCAVDTHATTRSCENVAPTFNL